MRRLKLRTVTIVTALIFPLSLLSLGMNPARAKQTVIYHVRNLGSLGGTTSAGNSINDRGWISGTSNLAGDQTKPPSTSAPSAAPTAPSCGP